MLDPKNAAKKFSERWKSRGYEKGQSQKFWIDLLQTIFGVENATEYISFEDQVHLDHTSFIDGYIPATKVKIEKKIHQANDKAVSNTDVANAAIAGSNGAVNGSLRAFCKKHFRKRLRSFLDEFTQRIDWKNGNKMTQVLLVKKQSEIL